MNKEHNWSIQRLILAHAAVLLLLLSWLFEPTRGLWLTGDEGVFHFFDNGLKNGGDAWRLFWALMNHEWFDYIFGLVLLSVFVISGLGGGKQRWAWHLAVISVAVIAAFIGTRIGNLLPIDRYSATLVFPDAFHLSEWVSGFKTKDYSDDTFPGDHGVVGFIIAGFAVYYLKRGYGWAAVVLAVMYVIPRLVGGAHWLSDELVGAVFVSGIVLAWFFYTPLASVLVQRFEAVWGWLLHRKGYVCDICHVPLIQNEINAIPPSEIVDATKKGFVPSRLPKELDVMAGALGVEVSESEVWKFTVANNSNVDWGLCKECLYELKRW